MKSVLSSTLLLAGASAVHALRIIFLSFLLDNADFGAVSTIMLVATLFSEFGSLGFSYIVYNQRLFAPNRVSRQSRTVGLFFVSGVAIAVVNAVLVSALVSLLSPFDFITMFLTVACTGVNMLVLSACRASASNFTHPVAYSIKAVAISLDIVFLGLLTPPVAQMALWGEVVACPLLLGFAWRAGFLRGASRLARHVGAHISANFQLGAMAISSAASGMLFFHQERIAGVVTLDLAGLGALTKLLLPKMIAAQGAFLIGVHFHRQIVKLSPEERSASFARWARHEWWIVVGLAGLVWVGGALAAILADAVYDLAVNKVVGSAMTMLALVFFFNPYSIMLQASSRFGDVALANVAAVTAFGIFLASGGPTDSSVMIVASALSALVWIILIRALAQRRLRHPGDRPPRSHRS